jgi:TetR/AcrR family transcriptional regulator, regulator of autoinduction and epiphytic fitness
MPTASKKSARLDGRRLRSEQSREAIVDAILTLLRQGHPRPGAQQIAATAGVSLRSVFRHFEDLDGLFTVATERQRQRVRHLFELESPGGSLRERVEVLVTQRARLYEEIAPMRRAALRQAPFHAPLRRGLAEANAALRGHLGEVFAVELARLSATARRQLLEALEAASSWPYWETLRSDQGIPVERARRIMARTLLALVRTED